MKKPSLLYIYRASGHHYKELDYQILSSRYEVFRFPYRYNLASLHQLAKSIKQVDAVFAWFASPFSAIAVRLAHRQRIPSIIVAGGFDVADYSPLRHGSRYRPIQKHFIKYALEASDLVLPVSTFNQKELLDFASPKKHQMIYNGVDIDFSVPISARHERPNQVVTVGSVDPHFSRIKGHFNFAEIANRLGEQARFILIGPIKHKPTMLKLHKLSGGKIEFRGHQQHDEVIKTFRQSKVYLQLSLYESFGLTVPEAMACGCLPIVSQRGALPEIVQSFGYIHAPDDFPSIYNSVLTALAKPCWPSETLRTRASTFSAENRQRYLLDALEPLVGNQLPKPHHGDACPRSQ